MGFERIIVRSTLSAALLLSAAPSAGAPLPQHFTMTPLPDPNAGFVAIPESQFASMSRTADGQQDVGVDRAIENLERAMDRSILAQDQAVRSACRIAEHPRDAIQQYELRARCSYIRR